jgi:hypothetical protein
MRCSTSAANLMTSRHKLTSQVATKIHYRIFGQRAFTFHNILVIYDTSWKMTTPLKFEVISPCQFERYFEAVSSKSHSLTLKIVWSY